MAQLGNIPGQGEFILQAANSQDEHDGLAFQQSAQIMANLNNTSPVARITHLNGLTVCQTNDGTVVVPIQWDYVAWTPMAERFITALKAANFGSAPYRLPRRYHRCGVSDGWRSIDRARDQVFREATPNPLK